MELETKDKVPAGFPYAGKVFVFQNLAEGKFVQVERSEKLLSATATSINEAGEFCLFQFVALPTGDVKLFSVGQGAFVSGIGPGWRLSAEVQDDTWSRFTVDYNQSIGAFILRSTQPIAASGPYVSVVDAPKHLRICEAQPRERWSYFQPFVPNGVPATDIAQFMP